MKLATTISSKAQAEAKGIEILSAEALRIADLAIKRNKDLVRVSPNGTLTLVLYFCHRQGATLSHLMAGKNFTDFRNGLAAMVQRKQEKGFILSTCNSAKCETDWLTLPMFVAVNFRKQVKHLCKLKGQRSRVQHLTNGHTLEKRIAKAEKKVAELERMDKAIK